jgi:hypothetical protein
MKSAREEIGRHFLLSDEYDAGAKRFGIKTCGYSSSAMGPTWEIIGTAIGQSLVSQTSAHMGGWGYYRG